MSETDVMRELMVEATRLGHRLMRNNIGVATYRDENGNVTAKVAYGVGGKCSGDLVGWTRRLIADEAVLTDDGATVVFSDVRYPIAVFTMVETKSLTGRKRKGQEEKIAAVKAAGGYAGFCRSVADYHKLIGHTR